MAGKGLGTLTLDLAVKTGAFEAGMSKAERRLDRGARAMEARAKRFGAAIGASLTAGAVAFGYAVKQAIDQADRLNDLNQRLGISAEALSGFAYAAKQTGTDIDGLGIGLKKLAKNMVEALNPKSSQAKLFEALDIDVLDKTTGKMKELEAILPEIADKFKTLNDETLEAALAQEIFGKSGTDLLEFLNLGRDGLEDMRQKLRDLGGELSQETLAAADQFNDRLNDLRTATDGLFTALAADLLPHLDRMVGSMVEASKEGSELRSVVGGLAKAFEFTAEVCERLDALWRALVSSGIALYNVADNLSRLNPGAALARWMTGVEGDSMAENWREAGVAIDQAGEAFRRNQASFEAVAKLTGPKGAAGLLGIVPKGVKQDPRAQQLEARLQAMLSTSGGRGKKGGKSDAEREAEQLEEAYKRMNAQMAETIALFNTQGEAAKVRYEIEHGELAKLSQAKKDELIVQAQRIDQLAAEKKARDEAIKKEEEETKAIERHKEVVADLLSDIAFETRLLGLSNEEKEKAIALRHANADAASSEGHAISAAIDALQKSREFHERLTGAMDDFRSSFQDNVVDVVTGAKSIVDALKDMANQIARIITQLIAQDLSKALFGSMGSTGGGSVGGLFSSLFGWALGGAPSGVSLTGGGSGLVGFAEGGNPPVGTPYLVGEHGPELRIDRSPGTIIPAGKFGGGVTINVNGGLSRQETVQYTANRMARELALSRRG